MDLRILRDNPVFWSRLGFCYDPPIADENGEPLVFDKNFARYTKWHDEFSDAGVTIHTCILHSGWVGVDRYDYSLCDKTLDALFASGKTKYFIPRVKLNVPVDWCAAHPEDICVYDNGPRDREGILALVGTLRHDWLGYESPIGYYSANGWKDTRPNVGGLISRQSFSSQQWMQDAGVALKKLIRHIEDGPYGDRILGYHVAYGGSGESMPWGRNTGGYGDFGIVNQQNFLNWGLKKYGDMDALRAAWGKFGDDIVPPKAISEPTEFQPLDTPQAVWGSDYMHYNSEVNTAALMHFSAIAKRESGGKLVGAFYGYVMDMPRVAYAGHLGWERLLDCPDIDFFAAPKSYWQSGPGDPGGEMGPAVSVNRRKLWVDECDNRTHLSDETEQHPAGCAEETYAVHLREWCKNITHNSGLWYMDLGGGWFDDEGIIGNIERILRSNTRVRQIPYKSTAQVLKVIDTESLMNIPAESIGDATRSLRNWQRAGAPIDCILTSDLFELPLDGVKLVLFSSAYALDADTLHRIREVLPADCRIVWQGQLPFALSAPDERDIILPAEVTPQQTRRLIEEMGVHAYAPTGCAVYADNRIVSFFPNEEMHFTADLGAEYEVYDVMNERPLGKTRYLSLDLPAKGGAAFEIR